MIITWYLSIKLLLHAKAAKAATAFGAVKLRRWISQFYTRVFPLLKAYGYPAVQALITDWVNHPANEK